MAALIREHPPVSYFVLAYVGSWAFEIPLAASRQGWVQSPIPFAIHYVASFGPMAAARIVMGLTRGRSGLRELFSGLTKWRAGPLAASIMSGVVWVWAVLVVVIYRPANLSRYAKQIAVGPEAEPARRLAVAGAARLIGR